MKKIFALLLIHLFVTTAYGQLALDWNKSYGGLLYDCIKDIDNTSDGGYISVGYTESMDGDVFYNHGGGDCWVIKTNSVGVVQWEKTLGGSWYECGYSIKQTNDGGYIVLAYSESTDGDLTSNNGGGDCWVVKLSNSGVIQWQKVYGGSSYDNAISIVETADGGYVIVGRSDSTDGDVGGNCGGTDCWILKINSVGGVEWKKIIGGAEDDYGQSIMQTVDGGYILTGGTYSTNGDVVGQHGDSDCWLVKLNNLGNIVWQHAFGGTSFDAGQHVIQTNDLGYIISGYTESIDGDVTDSHEGGDGWIVKCDSLGAIEWQNSIGSSGNDNALSILQLMDGSYILTGYSEINDGDVTGNHGHFDCWVVVLDQLGEIYLQKSFGGMSMDVGYSIKQTLSGDFVIAGYSESNDGDVIGSYGNGDSWIIKLNFSSVGVEGNSEPIAIKASPNPSSGNFCFIGLEEGSSIDIYDVTGKIVFQIKETPVNYSVDLSDKEKGIYLYNVMSKNQINSKGKIIIN